MFHIPAHKNLQNPPAQIRNGGKAQADVNALQSRLNEIFGVKRRRADQIARKAVKRSMMEETS